MSDWTRNDSIRLGEIAQQVGLLPTDAEEALTLGARFYAHGFTGSEIDEMIRWQYSQWDAGVSVPPWHPDHSRNRGTK